MREEINKAIEILKRGETLIYPTDTIWGIGCDAKNEKAVELIYEIKNRPLEKSFIILLDTANKLESYVQEVPEVCWDLIEFATKPLTIIYPNAKNLPKNAINSDGSIAIRIVKEGFAHELIKKFKNPLVSTSCNLSGNVSPKKFNEIEEAVLEKVHYVVNLPDEGSGEASTIMRIDLSGKFEFLRR